MLMKLIKIRLNNDFCKYVKMLFLHEGNFDNSDSIYVDFYRKFTLC